MNKPKTKAYKKILVRNTEQPIPKSKIVVIKSSRRKLSTEDEAQHTETGHKEANRSSDISLDLPELYSTLKISKDIDKVVNLNKKIKNCDNVDKKLTVSKKVARKVNFPFGQSIYKDLIPLTSDGNGSQPSSIQSEMQCESERPTPRRCLCASVIEKYKTEFVTNRELRFYQMLNRYKDDTDDSSSISSSSGNYYIHKYKDYFDDLSITSSDGLY